MPLDSSAGSRAIQRAARGNDRDDPLCENGCNASQLAMAAGLAIEQYAIEAKDRMRQSKGRGAKKGAPDGAPLSGNLPATSKDRDAARAAKNFGAKQRSVERAAKVAKKDSPALVAAVRQLEGGLKKTTFFSTFLPDGRFSDAAAATRRLLTRTRSPSW